MIGDFSDAESRARAKLAGIIAGARKNRVSGDPPLPKNFDETTPLSLNAAARIAFPHGGITGGALLRLIRQRKLPERWLQSRRVTTLADISAMVDASRSIQALIGTVYVIGYGDKIKIGFTSQSVASRLAGIATGCPEELTVYFEFKGCPAAFERELHRRFGQYRVRGEWFRKDPQLMGELAAIAAEQSPIRG